MAHLICPRCKTNLKLEVPPGGKVQCSTCGAGIRVARPPGSSSEAVQSRPVAPPPPPVVMAIRDPVSLPPAMSVVPVMARLDRSSPKAPAQGMSSSVIVAIAGCSALGVTVIALVVLLLLRRGAEPEAVQTPPPQVAPEDPAAAQPVALQNDPAKAPIDPVAMADLGNGSLSFQTLDALKRASVYVRVQAGEQLSSGSGFLARVDGGTGFVVTNHHVIAPPRDRIIVVWKQTPANPRLPGRPSRGGSISVMQTKGFENPTYMVVFNSGTNEEKSYPAEVAADDAKNDLAVLRLQNPPANALPVAIDPQTPLVETMPVFIFGFPFGELLATGKGNAAITVGKASVSSIRRDDQGELRVVQINGDLNPGNSGGPVVDTRGRLVGVAVATLKGTQIGLLIPAARLTNLLANAPAQGVLAVNSDPPPNNAPPRLANENRPVPPPPDRAAPPVARPAPPAKQPLTDAELDVLLGSLNSSNFAVINGTLLRLSRAKPVDEQRAKVVKTVTAMARVTEFNVDMHVASVLGVWGNSKVVPTLVEILDSKNVLARNEAMRSLGKLKDPRAAEPLARRLVPFESRHLASAALQEIGPEAEKAVLPYLKNDDLFLRTEVCNILQAIGTQECLPDLRAALADSNGLVRMAAQRALAAVEVRKK